MRPGPHSGEARQFQSYSRCLMQCFNKTGKIFRVTWSVHANRILSASTCCYASQKLFLSPSPRVEWIVNFQSLGDPSVGPPPLQELRLQRTLRQTAASVAAPAFAVSGADVQGSSHLAANCLVSPCPARQGTASQESTAPPLTPHQNLQALSTSIFSCPSLDCFTPPMVVSANQGLSPLH